MTGSQQGEKTPRFPFTWSCEDARRRKSLTMGEATLSSGWAGSAARTWVLEEV